MPSSMGIEQASTDIEGGFVAVTVVDDRGDAIAGARVTLGKDGHATDTDGHGMARIGPVPARGYAVLASAAGHQAIDDAATVDVTAGQTASLTIHLETAALLSGRVVDQDGRPIARVRVSAWEAEDGGEIHHGRAETSPDGAFAIDGLAAGRVGLTVDDDHFMVLRTDAVAPAQGVRLVLQPGLRLGGRVEDDRGAPVHGMISVQDAEGTGRLADVGADGRFELGGLAPGRADLQFLEERDGLKGRNPAEVREQLDLKDSRPDHVVRLVRGERIAGRVIDERGEPVGGVWVTAVALVNPPTIPPSLVTGPDGHFEFERLPSGDFKVGAARGAYAESDGWVVARTGDSRLVLTLRSAPKAHGRVVTADGKPVPSFTFDGDVRTDPGGQFSEDVEEKDGRIEFSVGAKGLVTRTVSVPVSRSMPVEVGDVVLEAGRTIAGRVVDATTRAPIVGARVMTKDEAELFEDTLPRRPRGVPTLSDGRFQLGHVPSQDAEVVIWAEGYEESTASVPAGTSEIAVELSRESPTGDGGASP
ncbi:MAG: carboxypeptidase regulatory-like domain-containing protein [Deltaproteobacteria bacterium]|nr:carboxypeptidase regulatory-like domain-containing protein [Deltaproteobacteria bacterium]